MVHLLHKLARKILPLSFLLIIVLFLLFGLFTLRGLHTLADLTRSISEHPLVVSNASLQTGFDIVVMHRGMKDVVLAGSEHEVAEALQLVADKEQDVVRQLDTIRENILGVQGRNLEAQTRKLFSDWKPIRAEVVQLLESGDRQGAILITRGKGARHVASLEAKALELTSYARRIGSGFMEKSEQSQSSLERATLTMTLAGISLSLIIAVFATGWVSKAEQELQQKNLQLQNAMDEIVTLRGIIPICSYCKKIRDDEGVWNQIEAYIHAHSDASFSHGICPDCVKKHFPEEYASIHPTEQQT